MTKISKFLTSHIVGQVIVTLCNLLFLPIYIKYLGSSGYAFYGLYVVFLSWLILLDGGLTPTIVREFGKFSTLDAIPLKLKNIFKSIELIFFCVSFFIICLFYFFGNNIIDIWLNIDERYKNDSYFILLLVVMLSSIGLFESLYRGALLGLQQHIILNIVISMGALLRSLGAVIILVLYELSIIEFFYWHILITLIYVLIMKLFIIKRFNRYKVEKLSFSIESLRSISSFAGSMFIILLLGTALTQLDKIILGKILSITELGYYLFAFTCVGIILKLGGPVTSTFYPKFCELFNQSKKDELIDAMNDSSQLILFFTIGLTSVLVINSFELLFLWSGDKQLAESVGLILSLLAVGSFLNVMTWIPYYVQISNGVTNITIIGYVISLMIVVPLTIILAKSYGAIGAAIAWPITNIFLFIFCVNFGLRKVFPDERKKWFLYNFFVPVIPIMIFILFKINFINFQGGKIAMVFDIIFTFSIATMLALFFLRRIWKFIPFLQGNDK